MLALARIVASLALLTLAAAALADDATLEFARDGKLVKSLDRAALEKDCGVRTITLDDPYYGRTMSFVACPLARVLEMGFALPQAELAQQDFLLRARDGYVKPATGKRLTEPGGYLAFADAEREKAGQSGWAPIDRKQVDPAPFYVVWENAAQHDTTVYPWPYQLVRIEIGAIASEYPHIVPTSRRQGAPTRGAASRSSRPSASPATRSTAKGGTVGSGSQRAAEHRRVSAGRADQGVHPQPTRPSATPACRRIPT